MLLKRSWAAPWALITMFSAACGDSEDESDGGAVLADSGGPSPVGPDGGDAATVRTDGATPGQGEAAVEAGLPDASGSLDPDDYDFSMWFYPDPPGPLVGTPFPDMNLKTCDGALCPNGSCNDCAEKYPRPFSDGQYDYCAKGDGNYYAAFQGEKNGTVRFVAYLFGCTNGQLEMTYCPRTDIVSARGTYECAN